ncbi:DUF6188 family protein [Streptomyces sp. NPDC051546]|uniref:DUF6188 family protein n=1 Tax=Streptomyces sp. NPDC051546 TaxID=3365655 RepID=UPI003787B5D5
MDLALQTHRVDRVSFDYALVLHTDQGAELRIETPGTVTEPDGTRTTFDPERPGDSAPVLLRLLHATISGAERTDGGTLLVALDNGLELDVPPHDDYEAWELSFTDGRKVVCMPGGESATWGPA